MFKIRWLIEGSDFRRPHDDVTITGISKYATQADAARQVAIFQSTWRQNIYFIIPA